MLNMPTLALIFTLFFSGFKSPPMRSIPTPRPVPTPSVKISRSMPSATPVQAESPTPVPTVKPTTTPQPTTNSTSTPQPTTAAVATSTPNPTISPTRKPASSSSIMDKINAYRASHGLSAVQEDPNTCAYAQLRANELVNHFDHNGTDYPYSNYSLVTENIAMTTNPSEVVDLWINSPGHAENMRKDTPYVCVRNNGPYYAYEGWRP